MARRPRVLVICPWYEPGFKAGGMVRAVANMVGAMEGELDISIVTADRDAGDPQPYPGVPAGRWLEQGTHRIHYLPPGRVSYLTMARLLRAEHWDAVHINGIFTPLYSIWPLLVLRGSRPRPRIIVQSHGMLGEGALRIKPGKKRAFLNATRAGRLYRDVIWHATSPLEAEEIRDVFGTAADIRLAANVPDQRHAEPPSERNKRPGQLRLCFFSRISPKKGLLEGIRYLTHSEAGPGVVFDIVGPIEDNDYWNTCARELETLRGRIESSHRGAVAPEQVHATLSGYHFMMLPTYNENFGYAILDALLAGCPVILSDQTPWRDLRAHNAGWAIPLADDAGFVGAIHECIRMDGVEYARWSAAAHRYALDVANNQEAKAQMRALLVGDMLGAPP